ncbi:MAG: choice-of-anchor D domain-containing protein [Terriglobales bacterium]
MIWTSLRNLLANFRRNKPDTVAEKRRTLGGGCRCVALALIVVGGMNKSCCPGGGGFCPPPKFDFAVFTPSSLTFAPQVVDPAGAGSASQSITLTATGSGTSLSISGITATAGYSQTNDCPASLATGTNCTIHVSFAPNAVGVIQGLVGVNGNSGVTLTGAGITPVSFSPSSLDFGTVDPGTTSAPQTLTLTNNQGAALAINSISTSGNYSQTNNCPASLAARQSCAIQASFAPTVSGVVPGAITVVTDASPGTQPVSLTATGSGSIVPNLSFSTAALLFADQEAGTSSAAQPVTLTNTSGSSSLTIISVNSSGPNYLENDTCSGQVLPPSGTCTINVSFGPTANLAPMNYAGAITVSNSDSTSPNVFGLSGKGVAPVTSSPQNVDFGTVSSGSQPTQTVTITNNHSVAEDVTLDVPDVISVNNSCPNSLPAGAQCTADLQYVGGVSSVKVPLVVTASSGGFLNPVVTNVSACGTQLQWTPLTFNFGSVAVGTPSDPQTAIITNAADIFLLANITDVSVAGTDSGDFSIAGNTCGPYLAPRQSCLVTTVFTPKSSGTRSAALSMSDNANCSPQPISLSGGSAAGPFTLTANTIGTGTGTITSDVAGITCGSNGTACSASFASGSPVTLTATPDTGIKFVGWVGACSGIGSCVLDMTADRQVMAVFGSNPLLNVSVMPVDNGAGTVTSSPAGINCGSGCSAEFAPETEVTLTPHPAAGSIFAGWENGCGGTGTCTVTMLSIHIVDAQFGAPAFSVAATAPTPAAVNAGESATSTVTVTSAFGFNSAVSIACSVQPEVALGPTCSIDSITPPANGTASGVLTIGTKAPIRALAPPVDRHSAIFYVAWLACFGFVGIAAGSCSSNRRTLTVLLLYGVLLGGLLLQAACGGGSAIVSSDGNPGTPPGSYTISVTGSSGSLQSAGQVTLTVQ